MYNFIFRLFICKMSVMLVSAFMCPRGLHNYLLPDPDNCNSYFHCVSGGRYYHKTCSSGLWFDARHKICNWPSLVECKVSKTQDKTMPSDKEKENKMENGKDPLEIHPYKSLSEIEKQGSWEDSLAGKRFRISQVEGSGDIGAEAFADKHVNSMKKHKTQDTVNIRSSVKCDRAFSFLTDPLRCDIFYQCYMWTPYQMVCPNGLYFDDLAFVCNWPHAVNCVNGHRKSLFEQVPIDQEATKSVKIQKKPNHERKSIKGKSRNRNHLRRFLPSNRLQTNQESKSKRRIHNRNKIIQDNSFHSTNSFSAQHILSKHNAFTPVTVTSSFPIGKSTISASKRSSPTITEIKPTPRVFSRKLPWNLTETRGLNIRKKGLNNGAKKEMGATVTVSGNKIMSSTFRTQESSSPQKTFWNQLKENRKNNTSENDIVDKNIEQNHKNPHNTSQSNESNSQHEPKDFPKKLVKIESTIKGSESEKDRKYLQIGNQQKIDRSKHSINNSAPNNTELFHSSIVVKNLKKEKDREIKNDNEYHDKLQCFNGSNCIGNNGNTTKNDSEFSSLIDNISNSDNFIVKIQLNKCNTSVNNCENKTLSNNDMQIIISPEKTTNKTPTDKMLFSGSNKNNTKLSDFNSQTIKESISKFYSVRNTNKSRNSTKNSKALSTVPNYDNFSNIRFTKEIPENISESSDELIKMKDFDKSEKNEDATSQEKLSQAFNDPGKSTEMVNTSKDSKSPLFITEDYSSSALKSKSETGRDRNQQSVSILHFPQKDVLNSKEINKVITQISKMTKTDFLKTADRNLSEIDHLNGNSKKDLIPIDLNPDLDLFNSAKVDLHKTNKENSNNSNISSSHNSSSSYNSSSSRNNNNNNNNSSMNNGSPINSNRIKNQEQRLVEQNNENISDSIKNGKFLKTTTERGNDFLQFNKTYTEREISSSGTSSTKPNHVKLTEKLLKTQHDIHERGKAEPKSSGDPTGTTLSTLHRTMETLNNEEHVTAGRQASTTSTAKVNAVNGTNSDIKITKTINETNRYKKVDLSTFSVQKEKRKNPEPFKNFLYRKIVELFSRFVPEQINASKLLSRLRSMTNTLVKVRNESEFSDGENHTSDISSKSGIFEENTSKMNITEQNTRAEHLDSKYKFTEITNLEAVSFSEIDKPIKNSTERSVTSLRNKNKLIVNESILYVKNSPNNTKEFVKTDKVSDHVSINVTATVSHEIPLRFNESIENSEEIQQKDIPLPLNTSAEINPINGSGVSVNLYKKMKNILITNIKTNKSGRKTKTVKFQANMTTTKENISKDSIPLRLNKSSENSDEIRQKDIPLHLNTSAEINPINGSNISMNLYTEVKNNSITNIETNKSEIKTRTVKFQTNMATTNENGSKYLIPLRFNKSSENSEKIQQNDIPLDLNTSAEINPINGSDVSVNLYTEVKNNSITNIETNRSEIKTRTVKFQTNMTTTKENSDKDSKLKSNNVHLNMNTTFSKNKTNMFDGTMSLEDNTSTSNTSTINIFQENKTYNKTYQKSDAENVEITDSDEISIDMSKTTYNNSGSLEETQREKSQSFAANSSINHSSKENKENKHVSVKKTEKENDELQNSVTKGDDILNISINTTRFPQEKQDNISHGYNETASGRLSMDIETPDQKQMTGTQRLHLSLEPEAATEEFKDSLDSENNTEFLKTTNEKDIKLYRNDAKINEQNESRITENNKIVRFVENDPTLNQNETETNRNRTVESTKNTTDFIMNYKSKEHNISYSDEIGGNKSYEQTSSGQNDPTLDQIKTETNRNRTVKSTENTTDFIIN